MFASIGCLNYLIDGLLCNLYVVCGYPDLFVPVSSHQVISIHLVNNATYLTKTSTTSSTKFATPTSIAPSYSNIGHCQKRATMDPK